MNPLWRNGAMWFIILLYIAMFAVAIPGTYYGWWK